MTARRTSAVAVTGSRHGSRARRAVMAPASLAVGPTDATALRTLAAHHLGRARGDVRAGARLADYAYRLRARGRGDLVAVVARALAFDGGAMLRQLAKATDAEAVERGVLLFVLAVAEHRIASTAALALVLRSCLQAVALDAALVRVLDGKPGPDDARRVNALDAPARLNLATGLQLERQAADARSAVPTIDVEARIREVEAQRARERAAEDEEEDEGGDDANP
jgi:hypothetical protein